MLFFFHYDNAHTFVHVNVIYCNFHGCTKDHFQMFVLRQRQFKQGLKFLVSCRLHRLLTCADHNILHTRWSCRNPVDIKKNIFFYTTLCHEGLCSLGSVLRVVVLNEPVTIGEELKEWHGTNG